MSSIKETAEQFFDACETGKGWDACQTYCHEGATFSSQTGALEGVETVQGYTEVIRGRRCATERGRLRRIPRNAHRRGWTRAPDREEGGGRLRVRHGFRRRSNPSPDEDLERWDQPDAAGLDVRARSPASVLGTLMYARKDGRLPDNPLRLRARRVASLRDIGVREHEVADRRREIVVGGDERP